MTEQTERKAFEAWWKREDTAGLSEACRMSAWNGWLAACAWQRERAQWRPIETAPKDGSYFLMANKWGVWIGHYEPKAVSGYVFDDPWRSMMLNHWHIAKDVRYNVTTHWMPLPEPPVGDFVSDAAACDFAAAIDAAQKETP